MELQGSLPHSKEDAILHKFIFDFKSNWGGGGVSDLKIRMFLLLFQ
jgi:hypothetical protein